MKIIQRFFLLALVIAILVFLSVPVFAGATNTGQTTTSDSIPGMIVNMLLIPLLPVVSAFIVALIRKKMEEISQGIDDRDIKRYLFIADDAVCTAVTAVSQTFVDTLKTGGKFDAEAMKSAFNTAKDKALTIMGMETQEVLKYLYGDINTWLESKIEYYVKINKK